MADTNHNASTQLPHQPDEIRPEDMIEVEQKPPNKEEQHLSVAPEKKVLVPKQKSLTVYTKVFKNQLKKLQALTEKATKTKTQEDQEIILSYAQQTNKLTLDDAIRLTGVKNFLAKKYLKELLRKKKINKHGRWRHIFYRPK